MFKTDKISMAISIKTYKLKSELGNTSYFSSLQWNKVIATVLKNKHTYTGVQLTEWECVFGPYAGVYLALGFGCENGLWISQFSSFHGPSLYL